MYIEQFIRLLDVIIWPMTLLIILSWFKTELQGFFSNLKKIQASADGVVFESFDQQLSKTRDLFPATTLSKSTAIINGPEATFSRNSNLSPSLQLKKWHEQLITIISKDTSSDGTKPAEALEQLRASGRIRLDQYQKRKNLLKLTGMPASNLSEDKVTEIQGYLNNLDI